MKKYRFVHTDVFTHTPFGGNQLAVFVNPESLTDKNMQDIAREMNFSESTFVFASDDKEADFKVRIFTPGMEVPFAGHPVVGTTYVLLKEKMVKAIQPKTTVRLELGIGTLPVDVFFKQDEIDFTQMTQKNPEFGDYYPDYSMMAQALSIDEKEIKDTNLPIQILSTGLPFIFVPIKSLNAVQSIRLNYSVFWEVVKNLSTDMIFVFTRETIHPESTVHSRMFAPGVGVEEDPATGSASGALGAYLVKHRVVEVKPTTKIISEQGYEINRPSTIYIEIDSKDDKITSVRVGGKAVIVGEGEIFIEK